MGPRHIKMFILWLLVVTLTTGCLAGILAGANAVGALLSGANVALDVEKKFKARGESEATENPQPRKETPEPGIERPTKPVEGTIL